MAESLCHLDLLLELQAESFQETLEHHVSIHYVFTEYGLCLLPFRTMLPSRI